MRADRWGHVLALLAIAGLAINGPSRAQDALKSDPPGVAQQQGHWRAVRFERQGKVAEAGVTGSITRIVTGDHVVWKRDGKSFAGSTIRLDHKASPATIDVLADGGPTLGKAVLGIYRQEGDRLWICMADADQPRPTAFEAPADKPWNLMEFERVAQPAP